MQASATAGRERKAALLTSRVLKTIRFVPVASTEKLRFASTGLTKGRELSLSTFLRLLMRTSCFACEPCTTVGLHQIHRAWRAEVRPLHKHAAPTDHASVFLQGVEISNVRCTYSQNRNAHYYADKISFANVVFLVQILRPLCRVLNQQLQDHARSSTSEEKEYWNWRNLHRRTRLQNCASSNVHQKRSHAFSNEMLAYENVEPSCFGYSQKRRIR
jgi:hypothetical protein